MKKFVIVIKKGSHFKEIESDTNFEKILERCETLSEEYNPLFRGYMVNDNVAYLEHEYTGKRSQAISMRRLVQ